MQRDPDYKFKMIATATDRGDPPMSSSIDLEILVVESNKKAPSFIGNRTEHITIKENYADFQTPIATFRAQ